MFKLFEHATRYPIKEHFFEMLLRCCSFELPLMRLPRWMHLPHWVHDATLDEELLQYSDAEDPSDTEPLRFVDIIR